MNKANDINNAYNHARNAGLLKDKIRRGKTIRKPFVQVKSLQNTANPNTKKGITFWAGELGFKISRSSNTFGTGTQVLAMANGQGSFTVYDRRTGAPMRFRVSKIQNIGTLLRNKTIRGDRYLVVTQDGKLGMMGSVFNSRVVRTPSPTRSPPRVKKALNPAIALQLLRADRLRLNISKRNGPAVQRRTWRSTASLAKEKRELRKFMGMPSTGSLSMAQRFESRPNRVHLLRSVRRAK